MSTLHRVTTRFDGLPGLPGYSTLYFHEDGASTRDNVTNVAGFWSFCTHNVFATGVQYTTLGDVELVDSTTGHVTGIDPTGDDITETTGGSSEVLPFSTQLLVQVRTGVYFTGRELRGRIFIPGIDSAYNNEGKPTDLVVSNVTTEIASRLSHDGAVYSPTKHQWAGVSSAKCWDQFAVLRSRRD